MTRPAQNPNGVRVDALAGFLSNPSLPPVYVLTLDGRTGRVGWVETVNGQPSPIGVPRYARAVDMYPVSR